MAKSSDLTDGQIASAGRTNPVLWMRDLCGWTLWDKQISIAAALTKHKRVAVPAAHGLGKSFIAARIALWWLYTHYPAIVVTTSASSRQVKDIIWAEIRKAHASSLVPLGGEVLSTELRTGDPDWYMVGFATNEDSIERFTGYHSPNLLLIFDQACGIGSSIWAAGDRLLTAENNRWLALSNTTDENSEFANICIPGRRSNFGKWNVIKITAYDSPNVKAGKNIYPGILSKDYVTEKSEVWRPGDPMWEVCINANFVEAGAMTVLHPTMIDEILTKNKVEPDLDNIVLSCDVGDEGSDPSVLVCALGKRLGFIDQVLGNNPMQVVQFIVQNWEKTIRLTGKAPIAVYVDRIGVGSGVLARLQELGYPAIGVNVGTSAIDSVQFLNQRIEMSWKIRELAEAHAISWDPVYSTEEGLLKTLREDMGIRYQLLPSSKIKLEDKAFFRRRMRRSSDVWDAMVMGFADTGTMPTISSITDLSRLRKPEIVEWSQPNFAQGDAELAAYAKMFGRGYVEDGDFQDEILL